MNAKLLPGLERTIGFLRDAARAPMTDWPSYVLALPTIPKVGIEAGNSAMVMAMHARSFIKLLPDFAPEADAEARAWLRATADLLQHEFSARYVPPYYVEKG